MPRALETRAELLKLARLLGRPAEQLKYLAEMPAADVRQLREQVTDVLFDAGGPALGRLAAGSRLLPAPLAASLAENVFGAVLSARVAGLLEPERAVDMASRLTTGFLADIAIELDPRRASAVIGRMPAAQVAAITRELSRRGEYVTMGRFVGHLNDEAIAAAIGALEEPELLQVAFVLEEKAVLVRIADMLGPERLEGVIDHAAASDSWAEVLDLLGHLSEDQQAALAEAAARRDGDGILVSLVRAAREEALWETVLRLAALLPEDAQQRVAELVRTLELSEADREQIVTQVRAAGLSDDLGALGELLS